MRFVVVSHDEPEKLEVSISTVVAVSRSDGSSDKSRPVSAKEDAQSCHVGDNYENTDTRLRYIDLLVLVLLCLSVSRLARELRKEEKVRGGHLDFTESGGSTPKGWGNRGTPGSMGE